MAILEQLKNQGWHLTEEGLDELQKNSFSNDIQTLTRKALDIDIREIGSSILSSELNKPIFGPVVLQILKVRNVSAPKSKQSSQGAPRMLKLILTDGHTNCQGIEVTNINGISLDHTTPGTKVLINRAQVVSGYLFLESSCCKVLGGNVAALVEKWQVSKLMPNHIRVVEDGPPPWVNFGMKIINTVNNQGFKSLENKNKETKIDSEFQEQRKEAISEAIQGAVKKVFGGGIKQPNTFNFDYATQNNSNQRTQRPPRKQREKPDMEKLDKPTQKVSLFNFLEDKLPPNELALIKNSESKPSISTQPSKNNLEDTRSNDRFYKNRNMGNPRQNYNEKRDQRDNRGYREGNKIKKPSNNQYNPDEQNSKYDSNKFSSDTLKFNYNQKFPDQNTHFNQENTFSNLTPRYPQEMSYFNQDTTPRYPMDNSRYTTDNNSSFNQQDNSRFNSEYRPPYNHQEHDSYRYNANTSNFMTENSRFNSDQNQAMFNSDPNSRFGSENRYYNNKPPRFQKQRNENPNLPKFPTPVGEQKPKPKTNVFVDKIAMEINNISLYNNKYENEKLKINKLPEDTNVTWQWKSGDRCLAKYWEDNKFYNAVVTEVTNRTCMVEFLDYGNFEEVLHCDCIPITSDKQDQHYMQKSSSDNQEFSNSVEFRRGKNRPFVKNFKGPQKYTDS